jgi:hypothetical protein
MPVVGSTCQLRLKSSVAAILNAAFYDCMDFYAGGKRGLALSDPVGAAAGATSAKARTSATNRLTAASMPAAGAPQTRLRPVGAA